MIAVFTSLLCMLEATVFFNVKKLGYFSKIPPEFSFIFHKKICKCINDGFPSNATIPEDYYFLQIVFIIVEVKYTSLQEKVFVLEHCNNNNTYLYTA